METNTSTDHDPTPPKTADEVRVLLKQQRRKLQRSQSDIAKVVGLKSNATISRIENGIQDIPEEKFFNFVKAYQLSEKTLAPLLSTGGPKRGRRIGWVKDCNLDLDVLPLIKKIAAGNKKQLTMKELCALIKGYMAIQQSMANVAPELRDLLLGTLDAPKTDQ